MLKAAVFLGFCAGAGSATAELYSPDALARVQERTVPSVIKVFDQDIVGHLPREMRVRGAKVVLEFPKTGPSPLAFFADPATDTIYLPLESIRFFDDLSTLLAWIQLKNCNLEAFYAYLWAQIRAGRKLPPPLEAFGISREAALADREVFSLSDRLFSSGLQFIIAHELGHLMLNHRPTHVSADSQRQETAADAFALDHFSRLGALPAGVFVYYLAAAFLEPDSADARAGSTHPASAERMLAMADRIAADPMAFASGASDHVREAQLAEEIAQQIRSFAGMTADGLFIILPDLLEREWPPSRFEDACPAG